MERTERVQRDIDEAGRERDELRKIRGIGGERNKGNDCCCVGYRL